MDKFSWSIGIGNDFDKLLQFRDSNGNAIDLTNYSFKLQIRKCRTDNETIATLQSPTDIDVSDAVNGNIIITITSAITSTFEEVNAVFDLQWVTDVGIISTVAAGNIQISLPITR